MTLSRSVTHWLCHASLRSLNSPMTSSTSIQPHQQHYRRRWYRGKLHKTSRNLFNLSLYLRTAVIPVLVEEGVTSLSTLTHLFTLTSSLDIQPSPTLLPTAQASTLPGFVDIDADFESGVKRENDFYLYGHIHFVYI